MVVCDLEGIRLAALQKDGENFRSVLGIAVKRLASHSFQEPLQQSRGGSNLVGERGHECQQILKDAKDLENALTIGVFTLVQTVQIGDQQLKDRVQELRPLDRNSHKRLTNSSINWARAIRVAEARSSSSISERFSSSAPTSSSVNSCTTCTTSIAISVFS